jgi:hypothetical protein
MHDGETPQVQLQLTLGSLTFDCENRVTRRGLRSGRASCADEHDPRSAVNAKRTCAVQLNGAA